MILSSKDIYRILRNNPVIDVLARIEIIDGPAPLGNVSDKKEFVVYIQQYPAASEFEASWRLDIVDLSDDVGDVFIAQLKSALPGFKIKKEGLFIQAEVTSLKTSETETRPSPKIDVKQELQGLDARFEELKQDIEDRMLLVAPGRPGKDGAPGRDGRDGIDGKDLLKTDAALDDLNDVSLETFVDLEKGQVLTWDGAEWTNLFIPQLLSSIRGEGGSSTGLPSTTIEFKYHNETGEPHDREFHTNNTDPTLVTILHVADTNNSGTDISSLLAGLVPNTDRIYVYKVNEPSSAHLYSVSGYVQTANGFEITVAHLETPGGEPAFVNNSIYGFTFITAGTGGGGGISDAPSNNNYYVRYNGTWVDLSDALDAVAGLADIRDGGDFSQGTSTTSGTQTYDGGDLTLTTSAATDASVLDGGLYTGLTNTTLDGGIATV